MAFSPEILDGQALANEMQGMRTVPQPLMGDVVQLPNAENLASSGADANFAEPQEPGMDFNSMITSPGGMG